MIHKQFQHQNGVDRATDVQLNLEYEGTTLTVSNIQLHSNFESGLPRSAYLEFNDKEQKWQLCRYISKLEESQNASDYKEWFNSNIANEISEMILDIKEDESPNS